MKRASSILKFLAGIGLTFDISRFKKLAREKNAIFPLQKKCKSLEYYKSQSMVNDEKITKVFYTIFCTLQFTPGSSEPK